MSHEGHPKMALHLFSFLKLESNSRLMFDPMDPEMGGSGFMHCDWLDFNSGVIDAIPPYAPKPLGKGSMLQMFLDSNSNHLVNKMRQCSQSRFVIFFNHGTIDWFSKNESTIETLVFGAVFCTMRHGIGPCVASATSSK